MRSTLRSRVESALGLIPTALALTGLLALLGLAIARPREDPARLVAALPPVLAASCPVLYLGRRVSDERRRHDQGDVCPCRRAGVRSVLRLRRRLACAITHRRHRPGFRVGRIRRCHAPVPHLVTALETPEVGGLSAAGFLPTSSPSAAILAAQVLAGVVRQTMSNEPSHLEKVEICLTERSTPFDPVVDDFVALSAGRGALRTSIGGNGVRSR